MVGIPAKNTNENDNLSDDQFRPHGVKVEQLNDDS